ncbi:hypothetical protein H6G96_25860 [Nostoc sp. FACHB-892]|nr:hypothetical protein [Nostoc sp. FACHB-892]
MDTSTTYTNVNIREMVRQFWSAAIGFLRTDGGKQTRKERFFRWFLTFVAIKSNSDAFALDGMGT